MLVLLVGVSHAAAEPPVLLSTNPAAGANIEDLRQIELRFAAPVELVPDSVKLTSISGEPIAIGEAVNLTPQTVVVPVASSSPGSMVLTWKVKSQDSTDTVSGAIAFDSGEVANATLDIAAATTAARIGELSRTLVITAAMTILGCAVVLLIRMMRRKADHDSSGVVPVRAVAVAGGAATALGGALALFMMMRGVSITGSGNAFSGAVATTFGVVSIAAIGVGVVAILFALRPLTGKAGVVITTAVGLGSVLLVVGFAQAVPPSIPEGDSDQRLPVGNGLQLSARVSPAAVGRNDFTIGVAGPREEMLAATDAPPMLSLRPLDGSIGTIRVPLVEQDDGGLAADRVLIPSQGRWRAEMSGSTGLPPGTGVFDFNVQANPRLTDGSR